MEIFAGAAMALYAAHHVADYWVQTDHQARHKGDAGARGRWACAQHVLTYMSTQSFCLALLVLATSHSLTDPAPFGAGQFFAAMVISGVTHYMADRRAHGLMFWLARRVPGKAAFLELGRPRYVFVADADRHEVNVRVDAPQLATGAWALDQAWHIFWGVFVAALVLSL